MSSGLQVPEARLQGSRRPADSAAPGGGLCSPGSGADAHWTCRLLHQVYVYAPLSALVSLLVCSLLMRTCPAGKDFGGRREAADADTAATAGREFAEETLGIFAGCSVDAQSVQASAALMTEQIRRQVASAACLAVSSSPPGN